jgi:DNA-binding XRE family transcriptional regulator
MEPIFVNWDQFAYGDTCTRDVTPAPITKPIRSGNHSATVKIAKNRLTVVTLAFTSILTIGNITTSSLPLAKNTDYLRHLNIGVELGKQVARTRKDLRMTIEEAAAILGVSNSSLKKLEEGQIQLPQTDHYSSYNQFIELGEYLNQVLQGKKFAISALFRTPIPAFGNKTAIQYESQHPNSTLHYISATFRRMYG